MSHEDDFDRIFNLDVFNSGFAKRVRSLMDEIFKEIKEGKIKGDMKIKEIKEPGLDGFVIMGRFSSDKALESLDPLEPLKPQRRRPVPERPFELPKASSEESREPLTDVFEQSDATKIFVEMPGEEEEDIRLKLTEDNIEIKGKKFRKIIGLPNKHADKKGVSSKYKNGVLEITIPKAMKIRSEDSEKETMV
jgi:HSP20 family molecular chaperone IbpA